jgi:hypothetical protein
MFRNEHFGDLHVGTWVRTHGAFVLSNSVGLAFRFPTVVASPMLCGSHVYGAVPPYLLSDINRTSDVGAVFIVLC